MTIDVAPGGADAPAAPPGMRIPVANTAPTTTLDRVTSILDTSTRAQLAIVLAQLARGIGRGGGRLRSAVEQLREELDPATRVAAALTRRRALLTGLVGSLSRIATAAESRDTAIAASLSSGATTLGTIARRGSAVSASVASLPATMTAVRGALQGVTTLARPLIPALHELQPVAASLPGALSATRSAVAPVSRLLQAADWFATRGAGGIATTSKLLSILGPTARALQPVISGVQPIVSAVDSHREGIGQLGERFSGVLSTNDANGPILRGLGDFEPFNPADFGFPSASPAKRAALAAQAASALTLSCLHGQPVSCLVRYLVPGLPGSVR
jgi:hypothetical protein